VAELIGAEDEAEDKAVEPTGNAVDASVVRKAEAARIGHTMLELIAEIEVPARVRRHLEEVVAALEA
jgi:hypothetical protein